MALSQQVGYIALILVSITASIKFLLNLGYPAAVVFDEVHYGNIIDLYSSGKFHIDGQPPLARILLWFNTRNLNQINDVDWERIGNELPSYSFAFRARLLSAVFSITSLASAFWLIRLMKYSTISMIIAAFLWLNDPALIVQGRFMFADSMIICFQLLALCFCVKTNWFMSSVFVGLAISSHSSSIANWMLICGIAFHVNWCDLLNPLKPVVQSLLRTCTTCVQLVFIPLGIYMAVFYVHFKLLPNSGPHDEKVSSIFQTSLNGGLDGSIYPITYGSYITLRSESKKCYLTSEDTYYPYEYDITKPDEDITGGSGQQAVSCTKHRSSNNWWYVTSKNKLRGNVVNSSVITLTHTQSLRDLHSHNVAAPRTKHKCEVSCYVDVEEFDIEPSTNWQIITTNADKNWLSLKTIVKLVHVGMQGALAPTNEQLIEEYGGGNKEVVTNVYRSEEEDSLWHVEEIKTKAKPLDEIRITFLQKFWEANVAMFDMLTSTEDHQFTSELIEWPLGTSSIAYFYNKTNKEKILLMGNPVSWQGGIIAFLICLIAFVIVSAREARHWSTKLENDELPRLGTMLLIFSSAWLLHMTQLFYTDRPKFLYNYLPALVFKHLLHACTIETISKLLGMKLLVVYSCCYLPFVLLNFTNVKPQVYGPHVNHVTGIKHHFSADL